MNAHKELVVFLLHSSLLHQCVESAVRHNIQLQVIARCSTIERRLTSMFLNVASTCEELLYCGVSFEDCFDVLWYIPSHIIVHVSALHVHARVVLHLNTRMFRVPVRNCLKC